MENDSNFIELKSSTCNFVLNWTVIEIYIITIRAGGKPTLRGKQQRLYPQFQ